jgi:hypothetical protein
VPQALCCSLLASVVATPVLAQAVISEPGYWAQFYPTANCQDNGPGESAEAALAIGNDHRSTGGFFR